MRPLLAWTSLLLVVVSITGCADEPPSLRVKNERGTKANVQVKLSNSNTININDVGTGQTTSYQDISEGSVDVSASIQGETASPTASFSAVENTNYTVVVASTTPPTLRVDRESK